MARHFVPSVVERKSHARLQRQVTVQRPKMPQDTVCWYWPGVLKPTETHQTYFLKRTLDMDPDLVHEQINEVIPGTTVKEEEGLPFFIILLSHPLTPREFVSQIRRALKGLI